MGKYDIYKHCDKKDMEILHHINTGKAVAVFVAAGIYALIMCCMSYYASRVQTMEKYIQMLAVSLVLYILSTFAVRLILKIYDKRLFSIAGKKQGKET